MISVIRRLCLHLNTGHLMHESCMKTLYNYYQYDPNQDMRFDKIKDAVALLICFLSDHLVCFICNTSIVGFNILNIFDFIFTL
jgi:hypothetical protein